MTIVIYSHGLVGDATIRGGTGTGYVLRYDPEAFDGRGDVTFTRNPAIALHFKDKGEAFEFIRGCPKARPRRPDGRANRPITAFNLELLPLGEEPPADMSDSYIDRIDDEIDYVIDKGIRLSRWMTDTIKLAECARDNLAILGDSGGDVLKRDLNFIYATEQIGQVIARLKHGPGPIEPRGPPFEEIQEMDDAGQPVE